MEGTEGRAANRTARRRRRQETREDGERGGRRPGRKGGAEVTPPNIGDGRGAEKPASRHRRSRGG